MTTEEKSRLQTVFLVAAYFSSLLILGAPWWKAAAISFVVVAAYALNMWTRWITRGAAALLVVAFAAWVDLVPSPTRMKVLASQQYEVARAWHCSSQALIGEQNPR